jgi:hypothetical protein
MSQSPTVALAQYPSGRDCLEIVAERFSVRSPISHPVWALLPPSDLADL